MSGVVLYRHRVVRRVSLLVVACMLMSTGGPAAAATPATVALSLTVSPTVQATGGMVTYTGVVRPVTGAPTNVQVSMKGTWGTDGGTCQPAAFCQIASYSGSPWWFFPTLTAPVTISFETPASPEGVVTLGLDGGAECAGPCLVSVTVRAPTQHLSVSYTPAATPILSGDTLHVTITGTADAVLESNLQALLSDGLGAPTSIVPDTAVYAPSPYNYIDNVTTLSASPVTLQFDTVVTAANGSTVTLTGYTHATYSPATEDQASVAIHVGPDSVAPTATAPKSSFVAGTTLASGRIPVRLAWSGADNFSGVAYYELAQSTDGSATWVPLPGTFATPTATRTLSPGHSYRFRARAFDHAGNHSAWATGTTFAIMGVQQSSRSVAYRGSWTTPTSTSWWGGSARSSSAAGATASIRLTGRAIGWVAARGPSRGKARVYVDGALKATVDLYAPTVSTQRVVWVMNWSSSGTRTVVIKVLGTFGRPRVDLDGFTVLR